MVLELDESRLSLEISLGGDCLMKDICRSGGVGSKGGRSLSGRNERLEGWEGELSIVTNLLERSRFD
jgi:hypothetical protein